MTYDHWKTTNPADEWAGPSPEELEAEASRPPEPGSLGLSITRGYAGRYTCVAQNYDGPGDIATTGRTPAEAASDYCEAYADREVTDKLTEAFREINALGGLDGDNPHNAAIDAALDILLRLGAKPDFSKSKVRL